MPSAGAEEAVAAFGLARGNEPVTPDTAFEIGSVTKVFTGILLAALALEGRVGLEDRISTHLPGVGVAGDPTLLQLATHASGLPNVPKGFGVRESLFALGIPGATDPHAGMTRDRYEAALARTRARRRRFRYSSLAFGLLGDALARAVGRPYEELVRERMCAPLGMSRTAFGAPASESAAGHSRRGRPRPYFDDQMLAPAGGLVSSAADMTRFLRANLRPEETSLAEALRLAQRPHGRIARKISIGLGWVIVRRGGASVHWHNGGTWGFRSSVAFELETGAAAVVLTNRARSVDRLAFRLLAAVRPERAL